MFKLKQIAIAALALSTTTLYAATHSTTTTPNQAIDFSSPAAKYELEISGLYLFPKYMGLIGQGGAHADKPYKIEIAPTPYSQNLNPHLTFKIQGLFHLQNDIDLTLNYYHMPGRQTRIRTDMRYYKDGSIQTNINPSWDALNAEFGQHLNISPNTLITYYAGIHLTHIETDMKSNGPISDYYGQYWKFNYAAKSSFTGIGPKFGLAFKHNLNDKLSIHINTAVGILAGNSKFDDHYSYNFTPTSEENLMPTPAEGSYQGLFPFIENQVGITYLLTVNNRTFNIDAGCFFMDYVNAQQSSPEKAGNVNNFALLGPYVNLKWLID